MIIADADATGELVMASQKQKILVILMRFYHDYDISFQAYCSEDGRIHGRTRALQAAIKQIKALIKESRSK